MWDKVLEVLKIVGNIAPKTIGPALGKLRYTHLKKKMDLLQAQFENPALYEFLMYKYPNYPFLKRNGHVFPVVVFPQNSLSFNLVSDRYDKIGTIYSPKYRRFKDSYEREIRKIDVEKRDKEYSEVNTYTMHEFDDKNGILRCGVGRYEDVLDSCDVLEYELLSILTRGYRTPKIIDRKTSLRNKLSSLVADPIRHGKERVCGLGISCLLVFKKNKIDLEMLLLRRSDKTVGIHSGLIHVIPSGMFQSIGNLEMDLNAKDNVLKEYLEELFNISDIPTAGKPLDIHTYIQYHKPIVYLEKLLKQGSAILTVTGLAVSLLNLRPEVCLLLLINDPEWWKTHTSIKADEFKFNDEVLKNLRLSYSDNDMDFLNTVNPEIMIPPGAAAFWLGIDKLREKYL